VNGVEEDKRKTESDVIGCMMKEDHSTLYTLHNNVLLHCQHVSNGSIEVTRPDRKLLSFPSTRFQDEYKIKPESKEALFRH